MTTGQENNLLDYVKPDGTLVEINANSIEYAESIGWKPKTNSKPGKKPAKAIKDQG